MPDAPGATGQLPPLLDPGKYEHLAVGADTLMPVCKAGANGRPNFVATTGGPEWHLELEIRVYRDATRRNTLVSTLWEELRATSGEAGK